ncbi:MAG: formylglycine-generating enzyme family protein, partial [Planctomycetales bacterium]
MTEQELAFLSEFTITSAFPARRSILVDWLRERWAESPGWVSAVFILVLILTWESEWSSATLGVRDAETVPLQVEPSAAWETVSEENVVEAVLETPRSSSPSPRTIEDVPPAQVNKSPINWTTIFPEITGETRSRIPVPLAAPFSPSEATAAREAWASHLGVSAVHTNSAGMKLALIPAGEFLMGSPESEKGRVSDETQHRVKLTQPFYLSATEVTQGQWKAVMGTEPWKGRYVKDGFVKEGSDFPATYVSWADAAEFCR